MSIVQFNYGNYFTWHTFFFSFKRRVERRHKEKTSIFLYILYEYVNYSSLHLPKINNTRLMLIKTNAERQKNTICLELINRQTIDVRSNNSFGMKQKKYESDTITSCNWMNCCTYQEKIRKLYNFHVKYTIKENIFTWNKWWGRSKR